MITLKFLRMVLKERYDLVVGEVTLREIKRKLVDGADKVVVLGRNLKTGNRKKIVFCLSLV